MPSPPAIRSNEDIRNALKNLPPYDKEARKNACEREPQLTKPPGALGRLEELAEWLCMWQGRHPPKMDHAEARVFAGNHGVVAEGVSAYPSAVTEQMVANFEAGGAAINQLCKTFDVTLKVVPLELDRPTNNFMTAPAMDEGDFVSAFRVGMETVEDGTDVICLGEMGIGNTTAAAAVGHALFAGSPEQWTGPGTGVEGEAYRNKVRVVSEGVLKHRPQIIDGIDVLSHFGGREMAAMAGAVLAARFRHVPVLLDGYVSTAAAMVLQQVSADALHHCQVGHLSSEPGHIRMVEIMGKRALLEMNMRLGEATGAVLAVGLLKSAVACHTGMATFAEASVSARDNAPEE